ncbi:MAG: 16S rRNA (cytosine(1402)-N(4))-methyltransferase [Actinomycetales bacterium mxb001]|nr:MAG: 16S rRNA (cytosine(1402)-N(4))-methyltransferase [Actinomycetales bacterium mxb001]
MTTPTHVPVMRDRVVALLAPALREPGSVFVDATLGLGGHSAAVLTEVPTCRLVGLDRDTAALEVARERLAPWSDRITLVHAVYDRMPEVLESLGISAVQGILFDLGVSSMQLDESSRGFAYAQDAPLDMRMDATTGLTAADILNTYSVDDLTRILRSYGEERYARRIAQRIVAEREVAPWTTSERLVEVVRGAIPAAARATGGHPAKRTFQALRIEVNAELEVLERAVPAALSCLAPEGRMVVMSYHSLEDRLVKQAFAAGAHPDVPRGLPVIPESLRPWLRLVTRGAEKASAEEISGNPRSQSVRVRAVERMAA